MIREVQVHLGIYKENIATCNNVIRSARTHFSQIIAESGGNSKILFSTIDRLLKCFNSWFFLSQAAEKCELFADYFKDNVQTITADIPLDSTVLCCRPSRAQAKMNSFKVFPPQNFVKLWLRANPLSFDAVPTKFLKNVFNSLSSFVLTIKNISLETGTFPDTHKTAVVKPLLKKPNLDSGLRCNYRPLIKSILYQQGTGESGIQPNTTLSESKWHFREISIWFQSKLQHWDCPDKNSQWP